MDKTLQLVSPYGAETAVYTWPLQQSDKHNKHDGSIEIVETIRWVFEDLPELREAIREELSDFTISGDMKNYDSMRTLCEKYNAALQDILKIKPLKGSPLSRPNVGLLKHIIQKSYNHAVVDPEKLNEYNPWTPEVYGETSFEFVSQMLDSVTINENDVFIDLGSGVGQVVLQVAASVHLKKCIGIERAEVPDRYARELDRQFRFWMAWFGKTHSDYELIKGDFFDHKFRETVLNASFIFCNNYAFGPKVDHSLKKMFEELKDGARIFSSKAFSPVNFRITDRNLNDIGTMMHVRELQPTVKGSVSWTDNSVSYYCHTIDRTKLEHYFLNMKGPKKEGEKRGRGRPRGSDSSILSSSNDSSSNDSIAVSNANHHENGSHSGKTSAKDIKNTSNNGKKINGNDECIVYGPTTRTAWKEYCQSLSKTDKNSSNSNNKNNNTNNKQDKHRGKEVRAPKDKPTLRMKEKPSEQVSGTDEETNETNENKRQPLKSQKTRGRPRKYPPGVTAVINRAVKKGSKVVGVNEPRRPGRPPKDPKKRRDVNPLDCLHEQTLLSVQNGSGNRSPAPGCIDRKLSESSVEETSGIPSIIVKDSSFQGVNEELDSLMGSWKNQMMSFLTYMQMPDFKTSLSKQIEEEKKRKQLLQSKVNAMEMAVKNLQERGVLALNVKLAELGIQATTSDDVLDRAREIIAQNKALQEKEKQVQAEVSREEESHQEILKLIEENRKTLKNSEPRRAISDSDSITPQNTQQISPSKRTSSSLPPPLPPPTSRPFPSNQSKSDSVTPVASLNTVNSTGTPSSVCLPPPASTTVSRKGSAAAKDSKGKREPKKRAAKKSSFSEPSNSIDDVIADVSAAKKTCDSIDAKSNDKETSSPASTGNPGSQEESSTSSSANDKERLTLTLVINRVNNSASVKSPSRTPPDKSPFGSKNSPKSPHENKRKQKSSEVKDGKSTKKTRSSKSSGPDTSSESETKIKIKLGSNKEPVSVQPVLPTPITVADKEKSSVPSVPPIVATAKTSAGTKRWSKGVDNSNFDKLLAVASHEMSLQNAQEAQAAASNLETTRVAPSPSVSSSSRPSSTSSSFATNTSLPQHPSLSDLTFNRRTTCVNTPPQTPSPSLSTGRPVTPGNSTSSSSLSPSLHHLHPGQTNNSSNASHSTSSASNHSSHDSYHTPDGSLHVPLATSSSHQSLSAASNQFNHFNSLQSMKNLASMTSSYSGVSRPSEQRPPSTSSAIEAAKGRKPGRPPKKSISNEMWASQLESSSKSSDSLPSSSSSSATTTTGISSNHPHLSSSLNQCQYPNGVEVASDYSVKSKQTSSSSSSYYNGINSINHSLASPSVIQSTGSKNSSSGRSSSGPSHSLVADNLSSFYSHLPNISYSAQGSSSASSSSYTSVIRRHDPAAGPTGYPPFPGFPIMPPGYSLPHNMQQYQSIQKEIERNYLAYCQNGLAGELAAAAAAASQQQKIIQRSSSSSLTNKSRDFNPASSFQSKQMSNMSSLMAGDVGPGK